MAQTKKVRKGPSKSATKFKVGTKKQGNDGNMWKIVENKNGSSRRWQKTNQTKTRTRTCKRVTKNVKKIKTLKDDTNDKVLFVFYTFDNTKSWSYGKFPKGWHWVGSGSTTAVGKKKSKYEQEEQFMGPEKTRKNMRSYLDKYFKNLRKNKVIKIYKIENSYSP